MTKVICRTLHECVDWNLVRLIQLLTNCQSHSTRVRGLKLYIDRQLNTLQRVALYTSAWIEIIFPNILCTSITSSHSTRVRGLKSCRIFDHDQIPHVALYTSAWIEIRIQWYPSGWFLVALYTSAWIEMISVKFLPYAIKASHSTRVRGLKFNSGGISYSNRYVALYTSAWIEITNSVTLETIASLVALYTSAWIEIRFCTALSVNPICRTLHECVDWNNQSFVITFLQCQSHSTRVRGLKWPVVHQTTLRQPSHSTRVRGLKCSWSWTVRLQFSSHSTRVRGLKFEDVVPRFDGILSHSTRVRGLKCPAYGTCATPIEVALYTSAWIEIICKCIPAHLALCRTLHECVDWNCNTWPPSCVDLSRTLHECVDWNRWNHIQPWWLKCRTLHECVDWNVDADNHVIVVLRRTLHECVDWNSYQALITSASACRTLHECVDWNQVYTVPSVNL